MNILLVEDEEINSFIIYELLKEEGHEVFMTHNGSEGLQIFEQKMRTFDLVLMDIHMPIMDGISATKAIRKLEVEKQTPIVVLTADVMNIIGNEEIESLFDGYILKPIDKEKLVNIVNQFN